MSKDGETGLWSEVSRAMLIANVLITAVAVGSHAAVMKLAGAEEVVEFWAILCRTAPLAIAVAVIGLFTLRQLARDDLNIVVLFFGGAATLFVATWIANRFGDLRVTAPAEMAAQGLGGPGAAAQYIVRMLGAYYNAYGLRDFWSSVVVGATLSFVWMRVAAHWTRRAQPAVSEETESNSKNKKPSRRKAA